MCCFQCLKCKDLPLFLVMNSSTVSLWVLDCCLKFFRHSIDKEINQLTVKLISHIIYCENWLIYKVVKFRDI